MKNISKVYLTYKNFLFKSNIFDLLKMKFIILLLIIPQFSIAHDFISISGRVTDSKTEKPIYLANISIYNSSIGVTTNSKGEFVLNISNS